MKQIIHFLIQEKRAGIAYFAILVCVLVSIWAFLVTQAISIQQDSYETQASQIQTVNE